MTVRGRAELRERERMTERERERMGERETTYHALYRLPRVP